MEDVKDVEFSWPIGMPRGNGESSPLRRVAALTVEPVPAYSELNARLAWQVRPALALASRKAITPSTSTNANPSNSANPINSPRPGRRPRWSPPPCSRADGGRS